MMYDSYIMRRTQIYLDEAQADEIARCSASRGLTASKLIREAITAYLADADDDATELARQRSALTDAFASVPRLAEGAQYVEELRRTDAERATRLEEQWRSR
jgi:hypothetical protein